MAIRRHVFLEHRLFCLPFVPALLRHAVEGMTGIVGRVEQDLQERLGGTRLGDSENGAARAVRATSVRPLGGRLAEVATGDMLRA